MSNFSFLFNGKSAQKYTIQNKMWKPSRPVCFPVSLYSGIVRLYYPLIHLSTHPTWGVPPRSRIWLEELSLFSIFLVTSDISYYGQFTPASSDTNISNFSPMACDRSSGGTWVLWPDYWKFLFDGFAFSISTKQ